jgi:hypothetical protein
MATFPYTMNVGGVAKFLKHIRDSGVPSKVTVAYLQSVGFRSSNDRRLIAVLKDIGFLDDQGRPTDSWRQYRGSGGKRELGRAIRTGYGELFDIYPDAQTRDDEAITNFIRGHSEYGARVVGFALNTFRVLCAEADFAAGAEPRLPTSNTDSAPQAAGQPAVQVATTPASVGPAATVNINIQLTLPASEDGKLYDAFFAAMKKHLLD